MTKQVLLIDGIDQSKQMNGNMMLGDMSFDLLLKEFPDLASSKIAQLFKDDRIALISVCFYKDLHGESRRLIGGGTKRIENDSIRAAAEEFLNMLHIRIDRTLTVHDGDSE